MAFWDPLNCCWQSVDRSDCLPPTPLTLLTTEMDGLPPNGLALSSASGAGGLFSAQFGRGLLVYTLGGALTSTLVGTPTIDVWLLPTSDGQKFEYGQATGDVGGVSLNLTNVVPTDGIWFDSSSNSRSAYVFDLAQPLNIPVGTYVASAPMASTVQMSQAALADDIGARLAFVRPPARPADFQLMFALRTYMSGEQIWAAGVPIDFTTQRFKVLAQNNIDVTLPAGGLLTLYPASTQALEVSEGRLCESQGRIRIV
jgi:hypothetical protein